jgi:hypothetical protein
MHRIPWGPHLHRWPNMDFDHPEVPSARPVILLAPGAPSLLHASRGGIYLRATRHGDAIVPPSFIERVWTDESAVRPYIDEPSQYR